MNIRANTKAVELAALVSQALEAAGIKATLSGGGAVSVYTDNKYKSRDLDFPNPRIESRQRFTDLLIPLSGLVVGRHSRYETAMESKIVTRPLFHTPEAPIRAFWTDRSCKYHQVSTHVVK